MKTKVTSETTYGPALPSLHERARVVLQGLLAADAGEVAEVVDMWAGMIDESTETAERTRHRNVPGAWLKGNWYTRAGHDSLRILKLIKAEPNV